MSRYGWIRLDVHAPDHDKVLALPDDGTRWRWVTLLCLAGSRDDPRFTRRVLRHHHISDDDADAMVSAGLLDEDGDALTIHDWKAYQPRQVTIDPDRGPSRAGAHPGRASRDGASQRDETRRDVTGRDDTVGTEGSLGLGRAREARPADVIDPMDEPDRPPVVAPTSDALMERYRSGAPRLTPAQWRSWDDFDRMEWEPFKAAWLGRGFLTAPSGDADGSTGLKGVLWEVALMRPHDLARWVREAPPGDRRSVVAYVLDRWHEVKAAIPPDPPPVRRHRTPGPTRGMVRIGALLADAKEAGL